MKKVKETTNESKREKIQDELKKEIKKLQRLREQVKGWQGSSEIKVSLTYILKLVCLGKGKAGSLSQIDRNSYGELQRCRARI
jgi:hypothetical protein